MICTRILSVLLSMLILGISVDAYAQRSSRSSTKLPDISVPPIGSELENKNRINPGSFTEFEIQNSYLGDQVKLQYQIALIQKLIAFQKQVLEVQTAYKNLGITYKDPLPSRRICEQIPVNVLCYNAYPELYSEVEGNLAARKQEVLDKAIDEATNKKGFDAIRADARPEGGLTGLTLDGNIDGSSGDNQKTTAQARKEKKMASRTNYEWIEIFCLSGECQGLMTSRIDEEIRLNVSVGDELPDGVKVTKIAPGRMEGMKNGLFIVIKPAPLVRKDEAEEEAPGGALSDVFALPPRGSTGNPLKERKSRSLDDLPDLPGQDDLAPPSNSQDQSGLGETGLF